MDGLDQTPATPLAIRRGTRVTLITLGVIALFACCVCPSVALIYGNTSQSKLQATSTANAAQQLSHAATFDAAATQDTQAATVAATLAVLPTPPTAPPVVKTPTATPKPKASPTPTPRPHASPTPTPKSSPTATPKPQASPSATPTLPPTAIP